MASVDSSGLLFFVCLVAFCWHASAVVSVPAHRGIQYRPGEAGLLKSGYESLGPQTSYVDLELLALGPSLQPDAVGRRLVVTTAEGFDERHAELAKSGSGGLLVLLPAEGASGLETHALERWKSYERLLSSSVIPGALYYAEATGELLELYESLTWKSAESLQAMNPFRNQFHASSPGTRSPVLSKHGDTHNLHALLSSRTGSAALASRAPQKPIFAVVAHYDALAGALSLSKGADSNGSGVAALLEIARLMRHLFAAARSSTTHDLLFVLTGGDKINFEGTQEWLGSVDPLLLDRVSYALCLDSLAGVGAGEDGLRLHVSRGPKTEAVSQLYAQFEQVAGAKGIEYDVVHKKINVSDSVVYWQHEQFSRKRVTSATLSHLQAGASSFNRLNSLDTRHDPLLLARNTRFVAEVLTKFLFQVPDSVPPQIFEGDLAVSEEHLEILMRQLTRASRASPLLKPADSKGSSKQQAPVVTTLSSALASLTQAEVRQTSFVSASPVSFYEPFTAELRIYVVKPFSFEITLALFTIIYLVALYVFVHPLGYQKGIASLKALMEPQSAARSKS